MGDMVYEICQNLLSLLTTLLSGSPIIQNGAVTHVFVQISFPSVDFISQSIGMVD